VKELYLGNFFNFENYITEPFKFVKYFGYLLSLKIIFYNFLKFLNLLGFFDSLIQFTN
jgi:hypothetical protein